MADEIVLKISLDDKEFIDRLLSSKKQLSNLVDPAVTQKLRKSSQDAFSTIGDTLDANLSPLQQFTSKVIGLGPVLGVVAAAAVGLKTAFSGAFEGERIEAVTRQFETLAKNVGITSDKLKTGLMKSAEGFLGDDETLALANEAIVKMGKSAERLPEIMDIAGKATVLMGGNIEDRFRQIVDAINSGRASGLRSLGLYVDQDAALKKYADSLGTTVGLLSDAGKRQAILNAALEEGRSKYAGIDKSIIPLESSLKKFKLGLDTFADSMATLFNKVLGPAIETVLSKAGTAFDAVGKVITRTFGEGEEAVKLQLEAINKRIDDQTKFLEQKKQALETKKTGNFWDAFWIPQSAEQIEQQIASVASSLETLKAKRVSMEAEIQGMQKGAGGGGGAGVSASGVSSVDREKEKSQSAKFEQDLLAMRAQRIDAQIALAANEEQLAVAQKDRLRIVEEQYQAQLTALEANKDLLVSQKLQMREEMEQAHAQRLLQIQQNLDAERMKSEENYLKKSETVMQGIARTAEVTAKRNLVALTNPQKQGQMAFDALASIGVSAFDALGRGAADGSNQIGKAVLGTLGDIASNYGRTMLLAGIFPPNPAMLAGGAALIALGGFLKAKAGKGGDSGPAADIGGASANISDVGRVSRETSSSGQQAERPLVAEVPEKKTVSLVVQGNIYETEQTRQRLMELIREATDYTDFQYKQVGA